MSHPWNNRSIPLWATWDSYRTHPPKMHRRTDRHSSHRHKRDCPDTSWAAGVQWAIRSDVQHVPSSKYTGTARNAACCIPAPFVPSLPSKTTAATSCSIPYTVPTARKIHSASRRALDPYHRWHWYVRKMQNWAWQSRYQIRRRYRPPKMPHISAYRHRYRGCKSVHVDRLYTPQSPLSSPVHTKPDKHCAPRRPNISRPKAGRDGAIPAYMRRVWMRMRRYRQTVSNVQTKVRLVW